MIPQPQASPSFRSPFASHTHIDGETCPWCEQEIPAEKLEEISGKIALREREQSQAITTRLEQTYEAERIEAEATAKANLEFERRQGAAREEAARAEAKRVAEAAAAEQVAAADAIRQQLETALNDQIAQARAVREAADKAAAAHQVQLQKSGTRAQRFSRRLRLKLRLGKRPFAWKRNNSPRPPWPTSLP